jgi:glucose/arabinose dehydrogenase
LAAAVALPAVARAQALSAVRVATDLAAPIYVAAPAGDSRLFIVLRGGTIAVLQGGAVLPTPFLDITSRVDTSGEGGLLGLAFPPDYAQSGLFYVYYTAPGPLTSRVSRFSAIANQADANSEAILFELGQPESNHNGGTVAIRDGFLYLGLGDGGGQGDPNDLAQNDASPFGKFLRLDLSIASPQNSDWQTWSKGFRNPFRFSFDRDTGDLYIGDVGGDSLEEIDVEPADSPGGRNYGWDVMEGTSCHEPGAGKPPCDDPSLVDPVFEYAHVGSQCAGSVAGGAVYRGSSIPSIEGLYFFADYCLDRIWSLRWNPSTGQAEDVDERTGEIPADQGTIDSVVAIAEDSAGELYFVDIGGQVFRLVPEPGAGAASLAGATALAALAMRRARRARAPMLARTSPRP